METVLTTRVDKNLYAKVVRRQKELENRMGIRPSISSVVRLLIEEATQDDTRKKRRSA